MTREKLIRVTSEDELRVGMIVVLKDCMKCGGGEHREMLVNSKTSGRSEFHITLHGVREVCVSRRAWKTAPKHHDPMPSTSGWECYCRPLAEGRLYRVEDGLDLEKERARDRELERVE